jgi:deoxyribodipyrimidine photo-lyase
MTKKGIVWFKTDLRLHDNETLLKAIEENDVVIPVFCLNPHLLNVSSGNSEIIGGFRLKFLFESILDLDNNLRKLGSGLILIIGDPVEEIPKIAFQYGARKVYAKREVAVFEKQLDVQIEAELWKQKCLFETYSTSTLYNASDLPFPLKDIPDVFTKFRKRVEKESEIRSVFETPKHINSPTIPPIKLPAFEELGREENIADERGVLAFKGGENAALVRLNYYLFESHLIKSYKETRNGLVGGNYSSKFSPWLANGCVSPRKIYAEIKKYEAEFGANESTYWLIFELIWRDYFRFIFKKHQHKLFTFNGISGQKNTPPEPNITLIDNWKMGKTGNDFIDANMNELRLTGFMSNRGRQNVASFFIHEMQQDWRIGARYFEEQLIDYDASSNWGNWAYLAGVGNDPRSGRQFNIEKQAKDYDASKVYRNLWLQSKI